MAFAGIDVGTSGCKMQVYDLKGNIIAHSKREYREVGTEGHRMLNPVMVWKNVQEVIKETCTKCPEKIEALSVASLGESVICINELGDVLCDSMVTGDKTGIEECSKLEQLISKEEIMNITGLPLSEMYSLPKLMWMHENTDVFRLSKFVFFFEDYIGYQLTGERKVSYSSASRSMAFDIEKKEWSERLLGYAGIAVNMLSEPVMSGTIVGVVTSEMAETLGLSKDTIVVACGHDQNCAALGSGLYSTNQGEDGQGTCEVMLFMLPELMRSPYMIENHLSCVPYVFPDTYLTLIEVTTCGALINWSKDNLFSGIRDICKNKNENFFVHMDERLSNNPSELVVLPQFGSSGNPNVDYDAKGLIWGLTIHTTPYEIYQAIKEGIAFQMLMAYEQLKPCHKDTKSIFVTGGGSASDYTLQLRADIFNIEMITLDNNESGTLGCAMLAATAVGAFTTLEEAIGKMIKIKKRYVPNPDRNQKYMRHYQKYKRIYRLMYNLK